MEAGFPQIVLMAGLQVGWYGVELGVVAGAGVMGQACWVMRGGAGEGQCWWTCMWVWVSRGEPAGLLWGCSTAGLQGRGDAGGSISVGVHLDGVHV